MERFKKSQTEGVEKRKNDDLVAFSEHGKALAASSSRSREELVGLIYESLLRFEAEDGSVVTLDLALEGEEGEEQYTAARVTITRPDGSAETLYFSRDGLAARPKAEATEEPLEETAEEALENKSDNPVATATEKAVPSLMELIEEYGLNKIADASEGLLAAIRARIEAMIEAAEETAEETETLEKVKGERESRNEAASATGTATEEETPETRSEGGSTGASRARTLSSYTRNATASFHESSGKFSRHY